MLFKFGPNKVPQIKLVIIAFGPNFLPQVSLVVLGQRVNSEVQTLGPNGREKNRNEGDRVSELEI